MYMERPMFPPFLPNYPQYPQNYQQAPQTQTMAQNNNHAGGITWVNGIEGAKAYQLAPNTTALLMDSEGSRFYIKTTDTSGMPTIRPDAFLLKKSLRQRQYRRKRQRPTMPRRNMWQNLKNA